jgi:5S rRNA maturation endonuclease (ribonuclease M5)
MNLIQARVLAALPPKRKMTPSGWDSFNAVCCHNNGEKRDTRKRGGIRFDKDGFSYHCFNCNFKAGWTPGKLFSKNTKNLLSWLSIPDDEIKKLSLEALKQKDDIPVSNKILNFELETRELPQDCKTIEEWIKEGCEDPDFLEVVAYILNRGMQLEWYKWMWSQENGYRDRVIIPFFHENRVVGWTGRKITDGKPKYLTTAQPGYVFNLDSQTDSRQFVIVVEGQFDAVAVDGVAIMHNEPNEAQIARIKALGREVIVVPDNDKAGTVMIKAAIEQGWSVSLPDWGNDVKDVADAVKKYGRIYTIFTILQYREHNQIKITMLKKKIENGAE